MEPKTNDLDELTNSLIWGLGWDEDEAALVAELYLKEQKLI
jgi:hypothetical protein